MDSRKKDRLERTVQKGMLKFILVSGVLGWGVSTAILFSIIQHFTGTTQTINTVVLSLVLFPVGGLFWGGAMWWFVKSQYKKMVSEKL
ncbi:hypothetical protein KO507_11435 [Gilvimarinus agarilyticus]|uniref:hypothetical protein n=1 Tax=Gilvimarinus sp. 2_MG-2023 TaxID=3062666 RepID=UPI001C0987AD|nr:hypothetical protein [Gilvimarinus sp. 2_MG-2023]MBU2886377.1 hypothetical protein [Gilvimarinus agarilyticus]MDO6571056.1 hypothetical protein [Gilvimarinus sp. 2_MG-2023]